MSFLDRELFGKASFSVEKRDRVGLIGANGTGKTTLFRLIAGELSPTDGTVSVSAGVKIGVVEQHACRDMNRTAYGEMLTVFSGLMRDEKRLEELRLLIDAGEDAERHIHEHAELTEAFTANGGLYYRSRAASMLSGLGFTEEEKDLKVSALSGGQRTKIALGKLLLSDSDLILLDEPTNHLDISATEWLEDFLQKYTGAAIIISHDRYFLDRVTNKTMEIAGGRIRMTRGPYSEYKRLREEQREYEIKVYEAQKEEIERIEGIIAQQKRFNRERNYITIASKQKEIDRIREKMVKPDADLRPVKLSFRSGAESGNDVLFVRNMSKSYGERTLFENADFNVYKGDRIFLIGANGCGKSTLLKCIIGREHPDSGYCRFGANLRLGYFDQTQAGLDSEKTVLEELYDKFPALTISELRGILGSFGFGGDDRDKIMRELSGGERARIALLELSMRQPNFLILDEPTNHLDIPSREALENALASYDGTMLCVSHDRYLINKLATALLILKDGELIKFDGAYDDYVSSLRPVAPAEKKEKEPNEYQLRKMRESAERKRQTRIRRLEEQIALLDEERGDIETQLQSEEVMSDYVRVAELSARLEEIDSEQESLMEEWESLFEV
ncbi:MAG: ABC-F family ATP-binding cassette domain-containing protein [Clostridia bacterium]|nr:ABC-F family ATP-binding cassette domain-containing protein [Clostridia bacterium]